MVGALFQPILYKGQSIPRGVHEILVLLGMILAQYMLMLEAPVPGATTPALGPLLLLVFRQYWSVHTQLVDSEVKHITDSKGKNSEGEVEDRSQFH
jgi:hypothetical protein